MKKLILLLLPLMLVCFACAYAETPAPIQKDELANWYEPLVTEAYDTQSAVLQPVEEGYAANLDGYTMVVKENALNTASTVLSVSLTADPETQRFCPRGISLGSTLEDVLAAYPSDNPTLIGNYFEAALYIDGLLPSAAVGFVLRDGQHILHIVHRVYAPVDDGIICHEIMYSFTDDIVSGIRVTGMEGSITEVQAQEEMDSIIEMQEETGYFAYPSSDDGTTLAMFDRDDLYFSGLDFLGMTPDQALSLFGEPQVDTWMQDSTGEYLRIQEWDGVQAMFLYDNAKKLIRLDTLTLSTPEIDGPRGIRVGDMLTSIINRFHSGNAHSEGETFLLYGENGIAPYATLEEAEFITALTYVMALDSNTVTMSLVFGDARLQSIKLFIR